MGLRGYATFIAVAMLSAAMPKTASAQQSSGWTPYTVELLRSNKEEETIDDIEWRSGQVPVYILPIENGTQPVVRIEAELKHRDWAIFWNNVPIRKSEATEPFIVLEVPLQGEYTPIELFGSRNVVQLEREVLVLHFPKWKETRFAQDLLERRDENDAAGRMGTRVTAAAGTDLCSFSTALTTSVAARLQAHTGLGSSGRFRLGMGLWYSLAEVAKTNSDAAIFRREIDVLAGYILGSRIRFSLFAGMTSYTLASSELGGLTTVSGPVIMPSFELPLGRKFIFTLTPRIAIYNSLPDPLEPQIEVGTQLHFHFGPREKGSFALVLEARAYEPDEPNPLLSIFSGLGYSL